MDELPSESGGGDIGAVPLLFVGRYFERFEAKAVELPEEAELADAQKDEEDVVPGEGEAFGDMGLVDHEHSVKLVAVERQGKCHCYHQPFRLCSDRFVVLIVSCLDVNIFLWKVLRFLLGWPAGSAFFGVGYL